MAAIINFKLFFSVGFLLSLVSPVQPQVNTLAAIARNNCGEDQDLDENLSCADESAIEGDACLERTNLCSGIAECTFGEDEGDPIILNALECNFGGKQL